MRYPINEDNFCKIYKQSWISDGREYTENEDEFARTLVRIVNAAYMTGLEDGKKVVVSE